MKHTFALVLALVTLSGCATISPLERMTSDDTVVLVPVQLDNQTSATAARTFYLRFSNGLRVAAPKTKFGWIALRITAPVKLVGVDSQVTETNFTGNASAYQLGIDLPYQPGAVVVWDQTFEQILTQLAANSYSTAWDLVETDPDHAETSVQAFLASKDGKTWADAKTSVPVAKPRR